MRRFLHIRRIKNRFLTEENVRAEGEREKVNFVFSVDKRSALHYNAKTKALP